MTVVSQAMAVAKLAAQTVQKSSMSDSVGRFGAALSGPNVPNRTAERTR